MALDSGSLGFDTCFQLLREVLHPKGPTYFNFGACPSIKSGCCSLYACSPEQEDLVRFLDALLFRFFPDKYWACLWVNFDCKKLPHRDSQNAEGSENFTFSLGNFSGGGLWLHAPAGSASSSTLVPPRLPLQICQVHYARLLTPTGDPLPSLLQLCMLPCPGRGTAGLLPGIRANVCQLFRQLILQLFEAGGFLFPTPLQAQRTPTVLSTLRRASGHFTKAGRRVQDVCGMFAVGPLARFVHLSKQCTCLFCQSISCKMFR